MRRLVSCLFVLLIFATAGSAETVSRQTARSAAEAWLTQRSERDAGASAAQVADCLPLVAEAGVLGYHVPLSPRGHLIVSARRELPAIKAFSFETNFDAEDSDGYSALILESLAATEAYLVDRGGDLGTSALAAMDRHRASWTRLLAGEGTAALSAAVGPFIESSWHQSAPYNDDCPVGYGGDNCVVGCVATSAAMIMKYWNYPAYGEGSHSYQWGGDSSCGETTSGGMLTVDFSDSYEWEFIRHSYSGGWEPIEAAAVAELNYEIGVAFDMQYGVCGSGTYVQMGQDVYPQWFRYSPEISFENRSGYTSDGWWERIRAELDAFPPRPMHYRITSHSIICDGYQEDGGERYYHMNYGWGGGQNAWYALDDVYCPWDGCSYLNEAMLVSIEPLGYFTVDAPEAGDIWIHSDPIPSVSWWGAGGAEVVLDLYQGGNFVARLSDWTANDGEEAPTGAVAPLWGTGNDFRVKVVGDDLRFAWSETFAIYGAGAWSDQSAAPLDDAGNGQAVAWGDCDGDDWPDLFHTNSGSSNRLLGNVEGTSFQDLSAAPLDLSGASRGAAWADYDNDGDLDLYLSRVVGEANQLYRNDGAFFTAITDGPLGDSISTGDSAWGDFDGDGYVDLFQANVYAADRLLRNLGDGSFADVTAYPLGDGGWTRSVNWVDYDGDGNLDLYLVRINSNKLYRNNGDGSFTDTSNASGLADHSSGYGAAWGDFDGDLDLDVYISNQGANRLYRNDGDGSFTDVTAPPLDDSGIGHGVAWGDFDADGKLDLYLVNHGANKLFQNQGDGLFADSTHPVLGDSENGNGVGCADYDRDGDLDLYITNVNTANRLLRNDGSGGHWLELDLVGAVSNRLGLGARVELRIGDEWQMRQLGVDASYLSRSAPTFHFGLGSATVVDSICIHWPGGDSQGLAAIAGDQRLVVNEVVTPAQDLPAAQFVLLGNHPNPFNPKTEIRFGLPADAAVWLSIHDLAGRRLTRLLAGDRLIAGRHAVTWDGRDEGGEPLPSGVYFARLESDGVTASHKLLLLK